MGDGDNLTLPFDVSAEDTFVMRLDDLTYCIITVILRKKV